jgi:GGDEF domain-containing protein
MQALQQEREPGARERFLAAVADGDTGLHSAEYWEHRLEEEFKRCNRFRYPLGLAGFTLEGEVTDGTLLDVAGVILVDTRDVDVACRVGRNTFVALLPHTGPEGTRQFAERVQKSIAARKLRDLLGEPLELTVRTASCPDAAIGSAAQFLARVLAPDAGVTV